MKLSDLVDGLIEIQNNRKDNPKVIYDSRVKGGINQIDESEDYITLR